MSDSAASTDRAPGSHRELLSPALRWMLLAAVVAVELGVAWTWVEPGPLSIDEVTYHRMTRDLVAGNGLAIWNGWEELASPELTSMYIEPSGERLVAQYPYGLPILAAPLQAAFGYIGLFLVNALAFAGAIGLCWRVSMQLLNDQRVALCGCVVLAGGTFAWEYSMAAWPHALALFFVLAAFSLAVSAWSRAGGRSAIALAAASGLVFGLGATARLDVLLCAPVLVAPLIFGARLRATEAFAFGAGMLPGLGLLSATNLARWGNPSPLSYGRGGGLSELGRYLPVGGLLLAGLLLVWLATRPAARAAIRRNRRAALVAVLVVTALALVAPPARDLLLRLLRGVRVILLDMRALPMEHLEPGMGRTEAGAVVYDGALKKALIQSLPYLVLLVVPLVAMVRERRDRVALALLAGIPALLFTFFSFYSWHGGMSLNMRYLLPALPFTSILVAYAAFKLIEDAPRRWYVVAALAAALSLAAYVGLRPSSDHPVDLEGLLLDLPLALAVLTTIAAGLWLLRPRPSSATAALALAAAGLVWASAVAFHYDAAWAHERRALHHQIAQDVAARIEPDSLLVADSADRFYGVLEHRDQVRVAVPWNDSFRDAGRLIGHHLDQGRKVYGVLRPRSWNALVQSGAMAGRVARSIARLGPYLLAEIRPTGPRGSTIAP